MMDAQAPTGHAGQRRWYQSIAAKLLIAFGLIAALTVGATWLSLIRFNQTDAVMRRVTDESLPLVKLSLSVETRTAEVVESASDLADSETAQDQFERMERVSGQIAELWTMLTNLQAIGADNETTKEIQKHRQSAQGQIGASTAPRGSSCKRSGRRNAAMRRVDGVSGNLVAADFADFLRFCGSCHGGPRSR